MPSTSKTYRQLQPEDRVTLASLRQQGLGVRAIAGILQRSPSTISRELQRNAGPLGYASTTARSRCQQRRLSGRPARKRDPEGVLFGVVRQCLRGAGRPSRLP